LVLAFSFFTLMLPAVHLQSVVLYLQPVTSQVMPSISLQQDFASLMFYSSSL